MASLLLIVVDCLRADRVLGPRSCATPVIDRLVAGSAVFTQAVASATTTTPSFATLLTGRYPPGHGVRSLRGHKLGDVPTLAGILAAQGYHTDADVTGPLLSQVGLDRGFARYEFRAETHDSDEWWRGLGTRLGSLRAPWFALVHLWDLHRPRRIHPELDRRAYGRTRYDRAVSTLDRRLPALLDTLSPEDIVVLTGDHGEAIERYRGHARLSQAARRLLGVWRRAGIAARARDRVLRASHVGHGIHLYEELIRIPLVIRAPGALEASVRNDLASHADVVPTVLDCLGLPVPRDLDGRSLLRPPEDGRAVYLETTGGIASPPVQGVRTSGHKYLRYLDPPHEEMLFDLARDPAERRNVAGSHPDLVASLRARLSGFLERSQPGPPMSPEEEATLTERLQELGYLE